MKPTPPKPIEEGAQTTERDAGGNTNENLRGRFEHDGGTYGFAYGGNAGERVRDNIFDKATGSLDRTPPAGEAGHTKIKE